MRPGSERLNRAPVFRGIVATAALLILTSCAGELATPGEALRIFGDALPQAFAGEPYEAQVRAVGGLRPFTFQLQEGELPPGLSLETGVIRGIPTETGTFEFTITVSDANLSRTFQDYSLVVALRPPPLITVIAPQTEIRTPVTVRLQLENASQLRALTTEIEWDAAQFALVEGSVESAVAGAALMLRSEPGRLHLEMAALGDPWNGESILARFTLAPTGTVVLRPSLDALFFDDRGGSHFQGTAPGAAGEGAEEAAEEAAEDPAEDPSEAADEQDGAPENPADEDSAPPDNEAEPPPGDAPREDSR